MLSVVQTILPEMYFYVRHYIVDAEIHNTYTSSVGVLQRSSETSAVFDMDSLGPLQGYNVDLVWASCG